ncbi:hypothetical protein [Leifsonia sp. TF02-11]|uniref:hypothetical protein n=1 Tax=Leifsonia sp. TF02-11 TaxID=2815212 RepID=UPI001AA1ADD2|nr:hypothetical protein [Leifsonia sp. TF02-11]MBO1740622.1 hypothetical protein [Leifsonia sp. TF02-11]
MISTRALIERREAHSPRSSAAIAVALVLFATVVWLGTEAVLSLLGLRPILIAPRSLATLMASASGAPAWLLVAVSVVAAIVGVTLLALAVLPGRRPRRPLRAEHAAVIADDAMMASALARRAAVAAAVAPDAVTVSLGRRSCTVRIVPVSGRRVDREAVRRAVADEFERAGAAGAGSLRLQVAVETTGRVGS